MPFVAMAAADEAKHAHASGLSGLHTRYAVLDHQAARGRMPHFVCRMEKQVWERLATFDHFRRIDVWSEQVVELYDFQHVIEGIHACAGSDATRNISDRHQGITDARHRFQALGKDFLFSPIDLKRDVLSQMEFPPARILDPLPLMDAALFKA